MCDISRRLKNATPALTSFLSSAHHEMSIFIPHYVHSFKTLGSVISVRSWGQEFEASNPALVYNCSSLENYPRLKRALFGFLFGTERLLFEKSFKFFVFFFVIFGSFQFLTSTAFTITNNHYYRIK